MSRSDQTDIVHMSYLCRRIDRRRMEGVNSIMLDEGTTLCSLRHWIVRATSAATHRIHHAGILLVICAVTSGCHRQVTIAVIPQTDGVPLWQAAHAGVEAAADKTGADIYWNAPDREDDVEAQISLVEQVVQRKDQGLVLAPDQALALISPVRHALSRDIPTVIISSSLPLPPGNGLSYVINDDWAGGQMAAQRVIDLLHGHGSVALLGVNPDDAGTMIRAHAFETFLAQNAPHIGIAVTRMGSFNVPREQQIAEEALRAHPDLDVIVALMWTDADGSLSALDTIPEHHSVRVIAFDAAIWPPFADRPHLDSVIQENTRSMGERAIELIHSMRLGRPVPTLVRLPPILITRDNVNSTEVRRMFALDWDFRHWKWEPVR